MLEILNAPTEVLSKKANPINKIDSSILVFIKQMGEALEAATDPIGVGLAAPQVGKSLRLFIVKPKVNSKIIAFINPKIINQKPLVKTKKGQKHKKLEGCLSLKDIWGEVERFPEITLEYQDEEGTKHIKVFNGFMATIIQHEIDHLEGVLFPKRVLEQKGTLYKSEKDEKGQDVFEEIKI
ncbi:MAG: peptide deformylase [Candidatus Levybacteria bacterium]|nr:peptide deformylase [Candidatus Levybacteria bacterium]